MPDLPQMDADPTDAEVIAAIRSLPDADLLAQIRAQGTPAVLDALIAGFARHVGPGSQTGRADVVVNDDAERYTYSLAVGPDGAQVVTDPGTKATGTITADLKHFLRVVDGSGDLKKMLLLRRLKPSGDIGWLTGLVGRIQRP